MGQEKLDEEFNLLSPDEIAETNDLQKALELINKEHVISDTDAFQTKKFIVKANEDIKHRDLTNPDECSYEDLDEIANQADQAFTDLMDVCLNASDRALGDIATSAQGFLTLKLNAKMAKTELKLKKLKLELDQKKFDASLKTEAPSEDFSGGDDIIVINN